MKKIYFGFLKISLIIVAISLMTIFGICRAFEGIKLVSQGENLSAVELIYGADNHIEGIRILDMNINF